MPERKVFLLPSVIALAHVCHVWREVVLNTPTLWNDIHDGCHPMGQQMSLRCSQSAPLVLSLRRNHPSPAILDTLLSESARLQDLYWSDTSLDTVKSVLASQAPNLETLTIGSDDPLHQDTRREQPFVLFGTPDGAPRLRALTLNGIFRVPAQHTPLLTYLHLYETPNLAAMKEIVLLLHNSPLLAEFCLDGLRYMVKQAIRDDRDEWNTELNSASSSPPESLVPLDRLRRLTLHEISEAASNWLLSRITTGPATAIGRISRGRDALGSLSKRLLDLPLQATLTRMSIRVTHCYVFLSAVGPQSEGICHQFHLDAFEALGGFAEVRCHTLFRIHKIKKLLLSGGWAAAVCTRQRLALQHLLTELPPLDLLVLEETAALRDDCLPPSPVDLADKPQFLYPRCLQVILYHSTATHILDILSAKLPPIDIIIVFTPVHTEQ
ncbi:hypothetical protein C8Q72DRAFT_500513 [Fomitopsis betulina]|nr:hypothetical protein C8Q72DRAFT_500513 [Fomitopsis betulina]